MLRRMHNVSVGDGLAHITKHDTGETYLIRVSGHNNGQGPYELTIAHAACQGDTDCDGDVSISDFLAVLAGWGTPDADVDGDGNTGITDFLAVLSNWGTCP